MCTLYTYTRSTQLASFIIPEWKVPCNEVCGAGIIWLISIFPGIASWTLTMEFSSQMISRLVMCSLLWRFETVDSVSQWGEPEFKICNYHVWYRILLRSAIVSGGFLTLKPPHRKTSKHRGNMRTWKLMFIVHFSPELQSTWHGNLEAGN